MPYESAHDLPRFVEMTQQLNSLKLLRFLIPRGERPNIDELERQLNFLGDTVDKFYTVLGPSNWVFHDTFTVDDIAALLSQATGSEDAERRLIAYYQDAERFRDLLLPGLKLFPELRKRMALIEKARDDYFSGRYYACILLLLTVMDGFVNEFETTRRGLHTRQADELDAFDSVTAHHLGLSNAHRTFTKSKGVTSDEPVGELYRNGIIHGTLLNYDNDVVATKAWNRLFAVADWAKARRKEQEPVPARPSWKAIFSGLVENARQQKATEAWQPSELLPGQEGFSEDAVGRTCIEFLQLWQGRNYGRMADFVCHTLQQAYGRGLPRQVRDEYEPYRLVSFDISKISHTAAAICEIDARLNLESGVRKAHFRWLHENEEGQPIASPLPADWHLVLWGPDTFLID